MADYDYGQLLDDFELGVDVMPDEDLTAYIERRRREFESKADGGSIGIEVLFTDKMANGGRVGMLSGGALKTVGSGIMKLFSKGDDVVDLAKQEEIFRSGDITTDFLEKVDDKVIKKFITTRDTKGPGGYGMYDNFDDMPNGLKAAELISRIKTADGGINYEAAELFIGKKLKGDETVDELIKLVIKKPGLTDSPLKDFENYVLKGENLADGGRVGLFMGGDPLTGQALSIYDSMKAYNFSDQEIANALSAQGLYTAGGEGGGGGEQETGIINKNINTFSGGDGITSIAPGTLQKQYQANLNSPINNYLYEMGAKYKASDFGKKVGNIGSMAMGALTGIPGLGFLLDKIGQPGFNRGNIREMNTPKTLDATKFSDTSGINTDFGGVAVDDLGRIVQTGDYLTAENVMAGYNTGFDLTGTAFDRIDKINAAAKKKGVPVSPYNLRKIKALKDFAASSAKSRKDALQAEIERAQRIKDEAAREAATQAARVKSISEGYGGHDDSPGATGPTATGAGMGAGGGYQTDYGFIKDGGIAQDAPKGLATMFTRRR